MSIPYRSRWEPESESKPAAATTTTLPGGLQISLPPSIAALVDVNVDPHVMELQRQLNVVGVLSDVWSGIMQLQSIAVTDWQRTVM